MSDIFMRVNEVAEELGVPSPVPINWDKGSTKS